jgi:hypothetical protein
MIIQCGYCSMSFPSQAAFEQHRCQEGEQKRIASTITKANLQVAFIYEHYPQAICNDGILLQKAFMTFPFKSVRYVYEPEHNNVGLVAENYLDFVYALKHASTWTRCGRAFRKAHPELVERYTAKGEQRELDYHISKQLWFEQSHRAQEGGM